jgi:2-dehydro-3-deoxyphosphogluconate aldolase/(4S)-4-hydroxy-2-oxoglutarate aldolase
LVEAGLPVIEVTLRTDHSLAGIRKMASVKGAIVGAGTVLTEQHLDQAIDAGATFAVSPGLLESLVEAARQRGLPYLPGVSDASHIMKGLSLGLDRFKFFPAEASGGIEYLTALAAPFRRRPLLPDRRDQGAYRLPKVARAAFGPMRRRHLDRPGGRQ